MYSNQSHITFNYKFNVLQVPLFVFLCLASFSQIQTCQHRFVLLCEITSSGPRPSEQSSSFSCHSTCKEKAKGIQYILLEA